RRTNRRYGSPLVLGELCRGLRVNLTEDCLTDAGRDLQLVVDQFGAWGVRWAFGDAKPEALDPALLLWKMHQRVDRSRLPPGPTVVEFDFTGNPGRRLWLVLTPREVSVCLRSPGFDPDLIVHADLAVAYRIWLGFLDYAAATRCGQVVVEGTP